jgi:hypothetical protein
VTEPGSNGHRVATDEGSEPARRLGELIVARGLITREQLEDALLEQQVSRKRLGTILVSNGAITPPDLTEALVSQIHGGTGTGEDHADDDVDDAEVDDDRGRRRRIFRRRRRAEAPEMPATAESDPDELRRELESVSSALATSRGGIAERDARIAELASSLDAYERELAVVTAALEAEIRELEALLQAARTRDLVVGGESSTQNGLGAEEGHVVFVPTGAGGHELRELPGDAPEVGSEVDIDGDRFVVVSHRRSPLAFDGRTCAYLQAP